MGFCFVFFSPFCIYSHEYAQQWQQYQNEQKGPITNNTRAENSSELGNSATLYCWNRKQTRNLREYWEVDAKKDETIQRTNIMRIIYDYELRNAGLIRKHHFTCLFDCMRKHTQEPMAEQ